MIKLVSIDDHKLFYEGLKAIIAKEKDINLVQGYQDGVDIIDAIPTYEPDIILLDMYLPDQSGIAISRKVKELYPLIKIVVLSLEVIPELAAELRQIGVEAYVSKEVGSEELLDTLRKVYAGQKVYDDGHIVHPSLIKVFAKDFGLTKRELQIYGYMRQGKSNHEIALLLNRSVMTIMTHRKNIKQKLRIRAVGEESAVNDPLLGY